MPAGDALSQKQHDDIVRAIRLAEGDSSIRFSVYLGALDGLSPREHARRLHAATGYGSDGLVLVAVDPGGHRLEIVTGSSVQRWLDDRSCNLAALAMTSQFAVGDLAGGIVNGVRTLAEHARHPRVLHTDEP